MTMEVRGPNGIVIRFPDGTDPATIDKVMREAVAKPAPAPAPAQQPEVMPSVPEDMLKAAGSGLATGAMGLVGLPGDLLSLGGKAIEAGAKGVSSIMGGDEPAPPPRPMPATHGRAAGPIRETQKATVLSVPTSDNIQQGVTNVTGWEPYQPKTTPGKYTNTVAEFLPGAVALGGGLSGIKSAIGAGLKYGVAPGLASEAAGQATEGQWVEPYARAAAAIGTGVAAGGLSKAISNPGKAVPAASIDEIKAASQALYKQADDAQLLIQNAPFSMAVDDIVADVTKAGIHAKITPQAQAALDELVKMRSVAPSLRELDQTRQIIGNVARSADPNERRLGGMMIEKLDDFLSNLKTSDVLAGNPKAIPLIGKARDLWKTKAKAETIATLFYKAENAAGANYTRAGMETALRQQFRTLANNPKQMRMFNRLERTAILKVVRGGPVENTMRLIGKFAPHGLLSTTLSGGAGYAIGGPIGAAVTMGVGEAGRQAATALTLKNANRVDQMVRGAANLPARHVPVPKTGVGPVLPLYYTARPDYTAPKTNQSSR